jgi:hypothetical protein
VPRQPKRYFWNVSNEHQHQEHDRVERPDFPHDLFDGDLADRASNEQDAAGGTLFVDG